MVLPADHPIDWSARTLTTASRLVTVAMAFLSVALSSPAPAQSPEPPPNPAFPIGQLTALATPVPTGTQATLTWSTHLPPGTAASDYLFWIRQTQPPANTISDLQVQPSGETLSPQPIASPGCFFQLWAIHVASSQPYLLDTTTVGPYHPHAEVQIITEDPYEPIPRTRADRPFSVTYSVSGLVTDPAAPASAKSVKQLRHVQSYGPTGTGYPLDRNQATLHEQSTISTDGTVTVVIDPNAIPGEDRAKVRGEERFSIFSQSSAITDPGSGATTFISSSQLDTRFVQIWPVADATITGITPGQILGDTVPQLTFQLDDLYPSSTTWAHVYQGAPQPAATGTTIPGSTVTINDSVPANRSLTVSNYGSLLTANGLWTIELLTQTPFGTDRLAHLTFTVQRGMTIADWRQLHFGDPANSGDGANANDFDHDGIPNILEFAFGLDPKQSSVGSLPAPQHIGDHLAIRFTPPPDITGILYGAESSTTLQAGSWESVPDTGDLPEKLFSVSIAEKPQLYLRLTAQEQ